MGIGRISHAEHASGLNRDLDTLLFQNEMRNVFGPVTHTIIDFGHIYMTNGLMHFEVEALMQAYAALGGFFDSCFVVCHVNWLSPTLAYMSCHALLMFCGLTPM